MKRYDRNIALLRGAVEYTYAPELHDKYIDEIIKHVTKTWLMKNDIYEVRLYIEKDGFRWFEAIHGGNYPVVWMSLESKFLPIGIKEE